MSTKFEQLLDFLVNEEQEKANELFHEIVVEKSREIYENLIAEEEDEEDEESCDDDSVDEGSNWDQEDETVESMFGEEDDFPVQDQTDDFQDDTEDELGGDEFGDDDFGGDEFGGEDDSAPASKSDIQDLEDALDELKAEFEALMAGEKEEPEHADMFGDEEGEESADDEEGEESDFGSDEEDEADVKESRVARTQGERMREYIEKVSATMDGGLVGSRSGETMSAPKEGKSPISSGSGKPTSGANAKNIAQSNSGAGEMSGTSPNADKGSRGLVGATKGEFTKPGTHNVNNVRSGIKTVKPVSKPGNKEGAGVGAVNGGEKAGQTGSVEKQSPLTGAPNRAK